MSFFLVASPVFGIDGVKSAAVYLDAWRWHAFLSGAGWAYPCAEMRRAYERCYDARLLSQNA